LRPLILCALAALLSVANSGIAEPYLPESDNEVLERLTNKPLDPQARELSSLQAQLARNPQELTNAVQLARRYIERARADSDPRYLGYAQAALGPWWNSSSPPVSVLVLRATIRQSNHDFDSALNDLALALEREPNNAQAWLTRATVLQVQGKYAEALQSCEALRRSSPVIYVACAANAASLSGQGRTSYDSLLRALGQKLPPTQQAWILTSLAEIAERLGLREQAEQHFQAALNAQTPDAYLKAAYADFLLDQKRYDDVVAMLEDDTRADGLLLRLALAEKALGSPSAERHIAALTSRFEANRLRDDRAHLREEARFTLHFLQKPEQALALAKENWQVQREPADARIVLEAALAANDPDAAAPVIEWLEKTRLEDVRIEALAKRVSGLWSLL
jgi:predicted Zn-dependent protease